MFHVGQLVVCVDDGPFANPLFRHQPHGLVRGRIYTVAALTPTPRRCVEVAGVHPPVFWQPDRFRPLDDTKLTIFRKMLAPAPRKEEVA